MKKTVTWIVIVLLAILLISGVLAEVERDNDHRIQIMNDNMHDIVYIDNFFAYADQHCGDYYIEAKAMILPLDLYSGWYRVTKLDGSIVTEKGYFGDLYSDGCDEFNDEWNNMLLRISYTTDGLA